MINLVPSVCKGPRKGPFKVPFAIFEACCVIIFSRMSEIPNTLICTKINVNYKITP